MIVSFGVYIMSKYDSFCHRTVLSYIQDKYHSGYGRVDQLAPGQPLFFAEVRTPNSEAVLLFFGYTLCIMITLNMQLVSPAIRSQQRKTSILPLCNTRRANSAFPYAGTRLWTDLIKAKTRLQL